MIAALLAAGQNAFAGGKGYGGFTDIIRLDCTPVKNQGGSGTCWSFATTSFLESELLRMGKGEFDLSEMFFADRAYIDKAKLYYLYHGKTRFGQGGQAHDVMNVVREYGIVPDTVFPGKKTNGRFQDNALVKDLEVVVEKDNTGGKNFDASDTRDLNPVLKKFIGKLPSRFKYNGQTYTAASFRDYLGINPDDYVEITSYTHHPFYKLFALEVPDNWSGDLYYNLPIDELMEVVENSLNTGYTLCWDGDTSEPTFSNRKAEADVPSNEIGKVDQKLRQETFFNRTTTDDHLMHIIGISQGEDGRTYFNTKNSWGPASNDNGGFIYLSEDYVRLKTIAILVNRAAIPQNIAKKLGLL